PDPGGGVVSLSTADRLEIHELISRHGHLVDDHRLDLDLLMTEDGAYDVTDFGLGVVRGLPALTELFEAAPGGTATRSPRHQRPGHPGPVVARPGHGAEQGAGGDARRAGRHGDLCRRRRPDRSRLADRPAQDHPRPLTAGRVAP